MHAIHEKKLTRMVSDGQAIGNWDLEEDQFLSDLRAALEFQLEHCEIYRFLCDRQSFSIRADLKRPEGIAKVPYITSNAFKESRGLYERLLTLPREAISCWTFSSGTSGDRSIVGRASDELSAYRRAYRAVLAEFAGHGGFDESLLMFPDPSQGIGKAGRMHQGSQEAFGILLAHEVGDVSDSAIRRYLARWDESRQSLTLDAAALFERLRELDQQGRTVFVGGPPALLLSILRQNQERQESFSFGDRCKLQFGGGGWGVVESELQVDPERAKTALVELLCQILGIEDHTSVDDCYGATETAAALAGHFSPDHGDFLFHQPPWTRLIIRDPQTLAPITEPGGVGLLEIVMPYGAGSYAGVAVLMDDVAELVSLDGCPQCGRAGMTLRVQGRASRSSGPHGGCGSILGS
jgi:Acyl-protein synthetase, LuxE